MLKFRFAQALAVGSSFCTVLTLSAAQLPSSSSAKLPPVAAASDEGELAIKKFIMPKGFKADLFAAEPDLANPVAFAVDESGRFYVCETFRLHDGVTDIRGKDTWLDEDLAARTVDDRLAVMKRHVGDLIGDYFLQPDRVRRIEDRNGDGKADFSTVFADNFNHALSGIGAGLLPRRNQVWYANIPDLWLLEDKNGDGVADTRQSLHYGFGVRIGFLGHDLHGLRMGPDGKIYFSIGDRGAAVKTAGKTIGEADMGSVFRCNPDGSDLEVFATGLRNPQELAFDEYGNLFTGDNNSDGGDRARFVYVVEGGDSGWRVGYQFIDSPNPRGPWNSEKLWHPEWNGQAAYLVPPLTNIADGPSGLTYYPGTGLSEGFAGTFFLADFHGGKGSGILSFKLQPKGASFEVAQAQKFIWECLPTDVDFGVDGGIYFSDWVQGWGKTGKGRIYRLYEPEVVKQAIVAETKRLLREGMDKRSPSELVRLMGHADARVRQEAQFALAARGEASIRTLAKTASSDSRQLARIHAIWGLGQIAAKFADLAAKEREQALGPVVSLLGDRDAEVRAQAAKVLGEARHPKAYEGLARGLTDSAPRVRFFSAIALGRLHRPEAVPALIQFQRDNGAQDPYLRHAGVMGLVGSSRGDVDALLRSAQDTSPAVRMGVLLALRRLERAEVAQFLNDADPLIALEAARAINDQPVPGGTMELANLAAKPGLDIALARRVVNANLRMGTRDAAEALAQFALAGQNNEAARADAISALGDWERPSGRDRVTGLWRPIVGGRNPAYARNALQPRLAGIYESAPDTVRLAAMRASEKLGLAEGADVLFQLITRSEASSRIRVQALKTLGAHQAEQLPEAIRVASEDQSELVRREATRLQAQLKPSDAAGQLASAVERGSLSERQSAFATLGTVQSPAADETLAKWMDKLLAGEVPAELQLDVLDAASKRSAPAVKEKLAQYEAKQPKDDPIAPYRVTLTGGDAHLGRTVFFEKAEAACLRCHKVKGEGGEVGPDLTDIGSKKDRMYLLEAIVLPNKQIAAGFESLVVSLKNGAAYAGVVNREDDNQIVLNSPEDGIITIAKKDIESRQRGLSAMPDGLGALLTKRELRDLMEYLATTK